jgi:hypothetical protein
MAHAVQQNEKGPSRPISARSYEQAVRVRNLTPGGGGRWAQAHGSPWLGRGPSSPDDTGVAPQEACGQAPAAHAGRPCAAPGEVRGTASSGARAAPTRARSPGEDATPALRRGPDAGTAPTRAQLRLSGAGVAPTRARSSGEGAALALQRRCTASTRARPQRGLATTRWRAASPAGERPRRRTAPAGGRAGAAPVPSTVTPVVNGRVARCGPQARWRGPATPMALAAPAQVSPVAVWGVGAVGHDARPRPGTMASSQAPSSMAQEASAWPHPVKRGQCASVSPVYCRRHTLDVKEKLYVLYLQTSKPLLLFLRATNSSSYVFFSDLASSTGNMLHSYVNETQRCREKVTDTYYGMGRSCLYTYEGVYLQEVCLLGRSRRTFWNGHNIL